MNALSLEWLLFSIFMCMGMSAMTSLVLLCREVATAKKAIALWCLQWFGSLVIAIAVGLSSALAIGKVFHIGI